MTYRLGTVKDLHWRLNQNSNLPSTFIEEELRIEFQE